MFFIVIYNMIIVLFYLSYLCIILLEHSSLTSFIVHDLNVLGVAQKIYVLNFL